jgi:hypothetical protein
MPDESAVKPVRIVNVDRMDGDAVIVSYSDETTSVYALTSDRGLTAQETLSDRKPPEDSETIPQGK